MSSATVDTPPLTIRQRYVERDLERKRLEKELEAVKGELADLEPALLEDLASAGEDKLTVNLPDGRKATLYIHRQLWATSPRDDDGNVDYDAACAALEAAGLTQFVQRRFNTNTLSSYVRELARTQRDNGELDPGGDPVRLPAELEQIGFGAVEREQVRTRKA